MTLCEDPTKLVTIEWRVAGQLPYTTERSVSIEQGAWVVIQFAEERSLQECQQALLKVYQFISFAVTAECVPITLQGYTEQCTEDHPNGSKLLAPVEIFLPVNIPSDEIQEKSSREMLFTLRDMEGSERDLFERWSTLEHRLGAVPGLYLGTMHSSAMFLNHRFLGFFQAMESYVRATGPKEDKAAHKAMLKKVLEASPKESKHGLKKGWLTVRR